MSMSPGEGFMHHAANKRSRCHVSRVAGMKFGRARPPPRTHVCSSMTAGWRGMSSSRRSIISWCCSTGLGPNPPCGPSLIV